MTQGRQRQPFEIPFTFSLNNILSLIADHLNKRSTFGDLPTFGYRLPSQSNRT
jgi:hypothetical protein